MSYYYYYPRSAKNQYTTHAMDTCRMRNATGKLQNTAAEGIIKQEPLTLPPPNPTPNPVRVNIQQYTRCILHSIFYQSHVTLRE